MSKPTIRKGPAARYSAPNETIVEFSNRQIGGLISLRTLDDGTLLIDVYNADRGVKVRVGNPAVVHKSHVNKVRESLAERIGESK